MQTALITGVNGFTGRYLAKELEAAGHTVYGVVHGGEFAGDREFSIDICERNAVRELIDNLEPDVIAHLAAVSFVAHDDIAEVYQTNIIGTRNLLEALADSEKRPKSVLLASSGNVYGNTSVDPIDESTPVCPANDYAVSKLSMEKMARLWLDKLPIVIARPFNYTGSGQSTKFLLPKIVEHYRRGAREIELGNVDVKRDFSDVRTVVGCYAKILELSPSGEVFNVCSGQAISLQQILTMMSEIAGYEIEVKINPAFIRDNEVKRLRGSNDKLLKTIGDITQIPLMETLRWMYQSGRANASWD
ncbi:MAG: GDP-mannose 4,6-dehydratase [Sedimenticola sp.]